MELHYSETNGIRVIKLTGKLDIIGTGAIETKFAGHCAGNNVRVLVDLSSVDFLASIGIRLLVLTAKSVASRGGKMALVNASPEVTSVLEVTGIPAIIPIYSDLETAQAGIVSEKFA